MIDVQTIGRYRVIEQIGADGRGVVYKAVGESDCREVAIKLISAGSDSHDSDAKARFVRGARVASTLRHRNIATVLDCGEHEGVPYVVTEFLRGQTLVARMRAEPALPLAQKLDVVAELCAALQFVHEHGIVHRGVQPSNILRLDDGTVKLLDFDIARVCRSTLTKQGDVLGRLPYLAPEQAVGKPVDRRADIFASGVILYELLTAQSPFEAGSPAATLRKIANENPPAVSSIVDGIPEALSIAVETALQKEPASRYQYAADLRADLQLVKMSLEGAIAC